MHALPEVSAHLFILQNEINFDLQVLCHPVAHEKIQIFHMFRARGDLDVYDGLDR